MKETKEVTDMFFNWATIYVSDVKQSLGFYRDLLKIPVTKQIGELEDEMCVIFLGEEGKTQVELIQNKTEPHPSDTMFFGFSPDNLEEIVEACKGNAIKSANGKFWYVKDPDGYTIQLKIN